MGSTPPELWHFHGESEVHNRGFLPAPEGNKIDHPLTYDELLARANPEWKAKVNDELYHMQHANMQKAIAEQSRLLREVKPDVVVIIGDDQGELFFENNMPKFNIFWGDSMPIIPRPVPENAAPHSKASAWGYGDKAMDVPVDSELALHMIKYISDNDIDVSHTRYMTPEYGGAIGPQGYMERKHEVQPRRFGMPHAYAFVVRRIMENNPIPIVPVHQNTCYPPNQPTPRRSYEFGQAIRAAIENWDSNKTVCIIPSGGLSHPVVDEELDRMALAAMERGDAEGLRSLPRHRLDSNTSETLNWVAAAGAMEHLKMRTLDYEPIYRTPAGTGIGQAFTAWQ
jgi:hypothetical protein